MDTFKKAVEYLWLHKETIVAFVVLVWQVLEQAGVIS